MRRIRTIADAIPADWIHNLVDHSKLGAGLDVATTTNKKSNPSSLAIAEKVGLDFYVRLLVRWKTNDPAITEAIIRHVLEQLATRNRKLRTLCVDASNEKFFATALRKSLMGLVNVALVASGEATQYLGEPMNYKMYLGNLYVNTIVDDGGHLVLPDEKWVSEDVRQVKRDKGTFTAEVDENGNHADAFDATKLALHAIIASGGPAEAAAVNRSLVNGGGTPGRVLKNPYAAKFEKGVAINA